jgi:spermidine synthase
LFNDFSPIDPDNVQPYVYEDERSLSLHFDMSSTQSRMLRADPYALALDYTRTMMGFVLVQPRPESILMIGLGGGSLAKYCHKHLPEADITVVEINPHVIAMREAFFVPADDARFRVVQDDGARFVARTGRRYDLLMVDGFSYDGQPEVLSTPAFYRACRAALSPRGMAVVNLHNEEPECGVLVGRIAGAFDGDLRTAPSECAGNRLVFAGRSADFDRCSTDFEARWAALAEAHRRTLRACAARFARGLHRPAATASAREIA